MNFGIKLVVTLLATSCVMANVEAGRNRYVENDVNLVFTNEDIEKELEFGRLMAGQILGSYALVKDDSLLKYVNSVGQLVLQNSSRQELSYYFGVIQSDEINAYATPGGYIFITTAILEQLQSEAELAAVLAHEIAHVVERHIVKALKIKASDNSATSAFGQVISAQSASASALFDQAIGKAFDILYSKGLKREDEFSADNLGFILTSMSGYDPAAYISFLQRIQPLIESDEQQLAKTHPSIEKRINHIENTFRDEGMLTMGGFNNKSRFEDNIK